jgi:hypothetical protein
MQGTVRRLMVKRITVGEPGEMPEVVAPIPFEDDQKEYLEYCEKLSQKRLESGQARALLEGLKNIKCERLKATLLKSR